MWRRSTPDGSVIEDSRNRPCIYPTAALESWGGKLIVHCLIVFPVNPEVRALRGGREYEARLRAHCRSAMPVRYNRRMVVDLIPRLAA